MFHRPGDGYPVESGRWRHNGGHEAYPVTCRRCDDMATAWREIVRLHELNHAYNLLYRPGCMYLMPRRFQGDYEHSPWTGGFAWSELAGSVTTFNHEDFQGLDERAIHREMARLNSPHFL
jgi:hypothetical protein